MRHGTALTAREEPTMDVYGGRCLTLDPGLTALALRGVHRADERYPFIERHAGWRRAAMCARLASWLPALRTLLAARPTSG
jgi:hypothetical protein